MEINTRTRSELKGYFVRNAIPTESNFADLIDGMLNSKDDGIVKQADSPLSLQAAGANETSDKPVIHFYQDFTSNTADWVFTLNPFEETGNTARPGFNIADGQGRSRLFIAQNSGNVGLGTVNPGAKLQVINTPQDANGNTLILGPISDSNLRLGYHENYSWIQSHGNRPLAINPVGNNVGLGTTDIGSHQLTIQQRASQTGQGLRLLNQQRNRSMQFWAGTSGVVWDAEGTANMHLRIGNADAIFIRGSDRNVGIGDSSPEERLTVSGRVKAGNAMIGNWPSNGGYVFFGTNGVDQSDSKNYALLQDSSGGGEGRTFLNSPLDIRFRINNDDKMILNGNGDLVISSNNLHFGSTVRQMLNLWSTGYGIGVQSHTLYFRTDTHFAWYRDGSHHNDTFNAGRGGLNMMTLSGDGLRLRTGGAWKPGGGSWGVWSDSALKKNVAPLTGALDRLLDLRGVQFEWKQPADHGDLTGPQIGLIAQEVEAVFPEWVLVDERTGMKGVEVRGFEALTVEALRELNARVEALTQLLVNQP